MRPVLHIGQRENRSHGDERFPFAAYVHQCPPGANPIDCHWHEESELLLIQSGAMLMQIGTTYVPLKAGEAVFVHSGDIHAGYPLGDSGCSFFAAVFHFNLLRSRTLDIIQTAYIAPLLVGERSLPERYTPDTGWGGEALAHIRRIRDAALLRRPGYELAVKAHLLGLLAELAAEERWVERAPSKMAETSRMDGLKAVLQYISDNYKSKIRIIDLAAIIYMSEGHFCRFFKAITRQTPVAYMNAFRLRAAAELLANTDGKIVDIALECGFDNLSYFSRKFREHAGMTPAAYRRKLRAGLR